MIKNYLVTAFRNVWRNKAFSAINILSLCIGISASIVIFIIAYYEFSYDTFEQDRDRIYRVVLDAKINNMEGHSAGIQAPVSNAVQREIKGVELNVPVLSFQHDGTAKVAIAGDGKSTVIKSQDKIIFTNPQYFSLLPYQWLQGSQRSLQSPFAVVLTESRARQYFGAMPLSEMVGKTITYNEDFTATVGGIVKDMNRNSSLSANEFISYATIAQTHLQNDFMMNVWDDWMSYSKLYLKLTKGQTAADVEKQLASMLSHYPSSPNSKLVLHLQPLRDVHFDYRYTGFNERTADTKSLYGLLAVALFLLLLGCINFINLTTANAANRAKEIGIRRTMGSSRRQLVFQFLGETFLLTLLAAVLAVALSPLLLHWFADFLPAGLSQNPLQQPSVFLFLFLLVAVVSLLAGLYPALVLSGYKPVAILKNQSFLNHNETRNAFVRRTLTISQFVIAQFFIMATVMVSRQINFSLHSDLGFDKDGIITFMLPRDSVASHKQQLLNSIRSLPEVEIAATGSLSPSDKGVSFTNISYPGKPDIKANIQFRWGDPDYLNTYKLKLLAGRNVSPSDSVSEMLINENYAKLLGFAKPEQALGAILKFGDKPVPVVGVLQDFHDMSMRMPISPLVFANGKGYAVHIRLAPNSAGNHTWQRGIANIQKLFARMYPEENFDYSFYDDTIASMYAEEEHTAKLLSWATGLAIVISCMGLLGLVIYTINTRSKEIGIRKVLGASVSSVVSLLSKDFIKLVVIAFLVAAPLAWWAVYNWLQGFTYRTEMNVWIFILSGLLAASLAFVTIAFQAIKAAMANPAKSLRTE